jgi:hypothetical protein
VFSVAGWIEGAAKFPDQVEAAARATGYFLPANTQPITERTLMRPIKPTYTKPTPVGGIDLSDKMLVAKQMLLAPQGKAALDYLHSRGLSGNIIEDAPVGWVSHPSDIFSDTKAPYSNIGYLVFFFPYATEDASMSAQLGTTAYRHSYPHAVFRIPMEGAKPKELKPPNLIAPVYNEYLLQIGTHNPSFPVYVVEGILDACLLRCLAHKRSLSAGLQLLD